jgi:D-glycero-D-manno-heptose 1,7-bisphosphate phosphatase
LKVVFLDRDGVINRERGDYTWLPEDFEFVEGLFEALRIWKDRGYQFIVITNQGGIAKGIYTHKHVEDLNQLMKVRFENENVELTDIFYSPYHDTVSKSLSRKPDSLMLEKAIALYNVDAHQSFMIGDSPRDMEAAEKVGVKGLKVEPNENLKRIIEYIP